MSRQYGHSQGSGGSGYGGGPPPADWYDDLGHDPFGEPVSAGDLSDLWDEEARNHNPEPPSVYSGYSRDNNLRVRDTLEGTNRRLEGSHLSAPRYDRSTVTYSTSTHYPSQGSHRSQRSRDLTDFGPSGIPSRDPMAFHGLSVGPHSACPLPGYEYPVASHGPTNQRTNLQFLNVPTRGHPAQAFWRSSGRRASAESNSSDDYSHDEDGNRLVRNKKGKSKKRPASSNESYKKRRDDRHRDGRGGGRGTRSGYVYPG